MMGKSVMFICACVILIAIYLYGANAYFYHRIHAGNLVFPDTEHSYTISGPGAMKKYAALGDSLTAGVGAEKYTESYPYLVAKSLAKKQAVQLDVFAYPGITSTGLIDGYLDDAIKSKPDIVTVLIGTNDIHNWVAVSEFEKNYRLIVERLSRETDAKIYLVSIPYLGSNWALLPPLQRYFDYKTRQFNGIISSIAAEHNVAYIDIATPTQELFKHNGAQYSTDSFHPSALGYRAWADIIYADIDH